MRSSLLGSGALHALMLAALLTLTSLSPRHDVPGGKAGDGEVGGLALVPVTLVGASDAAAAGRSARQRAAGSPPSTSESVRALTVPPVHQLTLDAAPDPVPPELVAPVRLTPLPASPRMAGATVPTAAPTIAASAPGPAPPGAGAARGSADAAGGGPPGGVTAGGRGEAAGAGEIGGGAGEARTTPAVLLHVALPALPSGFDSQDARGARVRLLLTVSTAGEVTEVDVLQGSGFSALDEVAVEAARELRYRPATEDGVPVASVTGTEISF